MNKQAQAEMIYDGKKKNMAVAYIIGLLLGGLGIQYLYIGSEQSIHFGVAMIASFLICAVVPVWFMVHMILVMAGVVHTYFVVKQANEIIREQCELLVEG